MDWFYCFLISFDMDNDGDEDLFFVFYQVGFGIYFNNSDGIFGLFMIIYDDGFVIDFYFVDFNGDG